MQQGHGLIHSPSSSAKTSKDAMTESKSPSPPVQALQNTSPPPQCTGQTRPHLLCIAYPIDCTLRDSWIQKDLFPYHTAAYGHFFFRRGYFSRLYRSGFIFLSFFPLCFCFLPSPLYLALCIALPTSLILHRRLQSFPFSTDLFFSLFSVFIVHSWIIQIADSEYSEFESCSWLTGSLLEMGTSNKSSSSHPPHLFASVPMFKWCVLCTPAECEIEILPLQMWHDWQRGEYT